jgi:histidine triad (HIT) family protein
VEVDYIFDLDDATLAGLHLFAKRVAAAIRKTIPCNRVAVVVLGLEVPHTHVHLIPMNHMADANFSNPKLKLSNDELASIADSIRKSFGS